MLVTVAYGNCFAGNAFATAAPTDLKRVTPCDGVPTGDPDAGALPLEQFLDVPRHPKGRAYRATPVPGRRPGRPNARTAVARPAGVPPAVNAASIPLPRA